MTVYHDDIDECGAAKDARARAETRRWAERQLLYRVLRAARGIYPTSRALRHKWVRARLSMRERGVIVLKPKVRIGCNVNPERFPRTMREALQ